MDLARRQLLQSYVATLAPLPGTLAGPEARGALAAALEALAAGPLPEVTEPARLLAGLIATSATTVRRDVLKIPSF